MSWLRCQPLTPLSPSPASLETERPGFYLSISQNEKFTPLRWEEGIHHIQGNSTNCKTFCKFKFKFIFKDRDVIRLVAHIPSKQYL